jgi:progranulin
LLATGSGPSSTSTITGSNSNIATPSTLTTGTSLIAVCPSSFYFCSAYYRPGCCRIGRDCSTTDCPAAASSSTLVSNGVTILVPVGASTGGTSYVTTALITGTVAAASSFKAGSCAGGWQSCAASVGGGCCPPNYGCGTICSATGGGATGVVSKVAPNRASNYKAEILGFICIVFGAVSGLVMLVL